MPTMDNIKKQKKMLAKNEKDVIELKKCLEEYRKTGIKTTKTFEGSLSAFVENKAKETGITISFIRPYGEKGEGVEIKVDEMDGKTILKFIYEMENNGVIVRRLSMRDFKGTGVWVVKINVEVPASTGKTTTT
jgi:hypothetical protein